jgi:hypothetical protein
MTCQENIDCLKNALPIVLAILALLGTFVIVSFNLVAYKDYVTELLGFAFVNLGVSR